MCGMRGSYCKYYKYFIKELYIYIYYNNCIILEIQTKKKLKKQNQTKYK